MALSRKNMSCIAAPSPAMALCGELAALFILRTLRYGFKETDALICLYCFLPCLGQTAWCELLWSSHPHLSSSLLILRQIKLLGKKKKCESSPSYFFSWYNLKNEGTETSPRRKLPSWWGPHTKAASLIHLEPKCTLQQIPAAMLFSLES